MGYGRGWPYSHEPRGSCPPGCEMHGRCHYPGCKSRPKISPQNTKAYGYVKGLPRVFCRPHATKSPSVAKTKRGSWVAKGIPVEKVRPLAAWLRQRYGTRQAAELVGMSFSGFSQVVYATYRKRVTPEVARRISTVVLAHRKAQNPLTTFDTEAPRLSTPRDQQRREEMLRRIQHEEAAWARRGVYKLSPEAREDVIRLYQEGWSMSAIGRKYNRNHTSIWKLLDRAGVRKQERSA